MEKIVLMCEDEKNIYPITNDFDPESSLVYLKMSEDQPAWLVTLFQLQDVAKHLGLNIIAYALYREGELKNYFAA